MKTLLQLLRGDGDKGGREVEKGMGREIIKIIMRHLLKYLDEVI
jgi:hypothetical protein